VTTTIVCILCACTLLAVYVLGVSIWLAVGMAFGLAGDERALDRVIYLAVRWPLVVIGVVR
jgi:hypothetical protein